MDYNKFNMTQLLKQAFNEAARLPEMEQNVIARWLLLELASEKRWMETFADSEDLLSDLADEAFVTHQRTGKCAVRGAI